MIEKMPPAGTDHSARANAHLAWASRYNDRRNKRKAAAHIGRALSYFEADRATRFGTIARVAREDETTIDVEQGTAVVNFGSAKLYTYNLVNCIAIGGSFSYGDGKKGAFLTHEAPTEYEGHQRTLLSIAHIIGENGASVDRIVLFRSAQPSADVYKGGMTVPGIAMAMEAFCGETFKTTVSVEQYEQADPVNPASFFCGTATVWPGGHMVGKAALRVAARRPPTGVAARRAPTKGTFLVEVRTSEHGDKVYFCPVCKRETGTYAVAHANDSRAFGHLHIESQGGQSLMCPNDGKIPVEPVEDRTEPAVQN